MEVSCVAADVVCAVRIMLDLTVKYREAKAELMKSGRIFGKELRLATASCYLLHLCSRIVY